MSAETAFQLVNLAVLPIWTTWIAAPRSRLAARLAANAAIFLLLCTLYAGLLGALLAGGGGEAGFGFDALRAALATPLGFLAGWVHWLAFDLFVGAWIVRESRRLSVEPRPYLVSTLLAGPLGLGAFLVRRTLRLRSFGQLGEVDLV
jgi:hypothetical protein